MKTITVCKHQNKETSVDFNFSCFSLSALTRFNWRPRRDGMHGKDNKITLAFATDDYSFCLKSLNYSGFYLVKTTWYRHPLDLSRKKKNTDPRQMLLSPKEHLITLNNLLKFKRFTKHTAFEWYDYVQVVFWTANFNNGLFDKPTGNLRCRIS